MAAGFREEGRINRTTLYCHWFYKALWHYAEKTYLREFTVFLEYLCDNGTGDAKCMRGRLTKVHKSWQKKMKRIDISTPNSGFIQHITIKDSSTFGMGNNPSLSVCSFLIPPVIMKAFYLDVISLNTMVIDVQQHYHYRNDKQNQANKRI